MRSRPREIKTSASAAASWAGAAALHALLLGAACAATAAWVRRAPRPAESLPVRLELGGTGRAGNPGLPFGRETVASSRPAVPADNPGELDPGEPQIADAAIEGLPAAEGRGPRGRGETGDVGLPDHAGHGRVGGARAASGPGDGSGGATASKSGPSSGNGQGGASGALNPAGDGGEDGDGWARRRGGRLPSYPAAARRRGWEGTAQLALEVDDRGAVTAVVVAESSGHKMLDDAAEEAAWTWTFEPAFREGQSVATRLSMPVTFRLTD